jgi:hypothetical protein
MSTDSIKSLTLNDFYKQTAGLNPVMVLPLDTVICGDCE